MPTKTKRKILLPRAKTVRTKAAIQKAVQAAKAAKVGKRK